MKNKPKTLQIPMDASLSAKWDAFCLCGKNIYSNNAGILDNLLDSYDAYKRDRSRAQFAAAYIKAIGSQKEVLIPQSLLGKFKVEGGHVWEHVMDRDESTKQGTEVFRWVKME